MSKDQKSFQYMNLADRWKLVEREGEFIAERVYRSFTIRLYRTDTAFVEVWRGIGFNTIYWIEQIEYDNVVAKYADAVQLTLHDI